MGQGEVLKYLEKVEDWKSNEEISNALKLSKGSVSCATKKLFKSGDLRYKDIKKDGRIIKIYQIR